MFGGFRDVYVHTQTDGQEIRQMQLTLKDNKVEQNGLALGNGNLVYVACNCGVECLDRRAGTSKWVALPGVESHALTIADDGRVFVSAEDGLYALAGDVNSGPDHPWPMLFGNHNHTSRALAEKQ